MGLYHANVIISGCLLLISSVLLFNFFSHYGWSLIIRPWFGHTCAEECMERYLNGPPDHNDPGLLDLVRDKFVSPPPRRPNTDPFDYNEPLWSKLVDWNLMQQKLIEVWKTEPPGVFVEVGAADGEFMSQTLVLERNLSWSGLLVEPDPRSYAILQQRRRNAFISPLCITPGDPCSKVLWMHNKLPDLPPDLQALVMARSKLAQFTITGDGERGTTIYVPCAPLFALLLASNLTSVDMLSVATGVERDHDLIKDVLRSKVSNQFHVKTLLIQFPRTYLKENPYPYIQGYIVDLYRSRLIVRLYWRKSHCRLLQHGPCHIAQPYNIASACRKYLCYDFAEVWSL